MQLKKLLFIPILTLCAVGSKVQHTKNEGISTLPIENNTALLEYTGSLTGEYSITVGAQLMMDSSIGLRYDITFQNGGAVVSHNALFYKYSNPYQTIFYNYLNHKSEVIKGAASGNQPDVTVVGKEKIDSFSCTHLRNKKDDEQQDYWMSTAVPGFAQVAATLKNIDPNLAIMSINQSIFNWGGLVKLRMSATVPKTGQTTTLTLNLIEAKTGLVFGPHDFDVPSK